MAMFTLHDFVIDQARDLLSAERQLVQALPKMAQAASHDELKEAFRTHLEQTREHVKRMEQVLHILGADAREKECKAMKGLLAEGEEVIKEDGYEAIRDVGLIAAAQRVEHYEIAAYGTLAVLAGELRETEVKDLLQETIAEEKQADQLLTRIAEGGWITSGINQRAAEEEYSAKRGA